MEFSHRLREALAHGANLQIELEVRVGVGDAAVKPAGADLGLVLSERLPLRALLVIPLGLAGDNRVSGEVAVGVVVLVTLGGLPAEQSLLGDPEAISEGQSLPEGSVVDEPVSDFGTMRSSPVS